MKIIKLNGRYRQYKEHRHTAGVRFDGWQPEVETLSKALYALTGTYGWFKDGEWFHYFGTKSAGSDARPYFITVRDENLLTMALLKVQNV